MKNLIIRTITGAVFVAMIIFSAIYSPGAFAVFFLIMALMGLWEFQRLTHRDGILLRKVPGLLTGMAIYSLFPLYSIFYVSMSWLWLALPLIMLLSSWHLLLQKHESLQFIAADILGIVFVIMPLGLLNLYMNPLAVPEYHTPWLVLGMFVILWTHDTFAYITGSLFGRHPLHKTISPKKTWEGSIGGFGFAIIAAYLLSIFSPLLGTWLWMLIAVVVAVIGTLGDLAESLLKRRAGVKDSGIMLPGHGGILDRFDSVLFVSPVIFMLILLTVL